MSRPLHIARVECHVALTVPEEVVELNVGYHPLALGESLAEQVDAYIRREGLGYYPALDFFRNRSDGVDPALITLIDEVAAWCAAFSRRELRRRLSGAFSNVQVERSQALAYAMPRVRPGQPHAVRLLGAHFAPSRIKLDLMLSAVLKVPLDELAGWATARLTHWVREPFQEFEVIASRVLPS